jgi:cytochrome P450
VKVAAHVAFALFLGALQAERSVTWMPAMKMWFVTRRADVIHVLRDTRTYSTGGANSTIADTFGSQMLSSDGALHRRYKSQCAGPFNAGAVRQCVETTVAARVDTLMAQLPDEGVRDLKSAIATPLSVSTICATDGSIASRIWSAPTSTLRGRPVSRSRPRRVTR